MKPLALALLLCAGLAPIGPRQPVERGTLWKEVRTADGVVDIYRDGAGCELWLGQTYRQTVSLVVCNG